MNRLSLEGVAKLVAAIVGDTPLERAAVQEKIIRMGKNYYKLS